MRQLHGLQHLAKQKHRTPQTHSQNSWKRSWQNPMDSKHGRSRHKFSKNLQLSNLLPLRENPYWLVWTRMRKLQTSPRAMTVVDAKFSKTTTFKQASLSSSNVVVSTPWIPTTFKHAGFWASTKSSRYLGQTITKDHDLRFLSVPSAWPHMLNSVYV